MNLSKNKLIIPFTKYFTIGVTFTLLNIFLMWLLIDILGLYSAIGASITVVGLFFLKYYTYILTNFMKRNFMYYASIDIASRILNVLLVWFLIEVFHIPTVYSSSAVVLFLFFGRFIAFKKFDLLK